jgi:hypothetical protein
VYFRIKLLTPGKEAIAFIVAAMVKVNPAYELFVDHIDLKSKHVIEQEGRD